MLHCRIIRVLSPLLLALFAACALAAIRTTLPVSAELATDIAREQFPVTVKINQANLFLTEPRVVFVDAKRIAVHVRFQAYDHRPEHGIAMSETGRAAFSGELDFDPETRQILLFRPKIDQLVFDNESPAATHLSTELGTAWSRQVKDPLRTDLPNHPYIAAFKENIRDVGFDGRSINLSIYY
ncbi:hypothetical protein F0M18_16505 [Pseudohalioglobus sediminis]|uniref:DUF1439 domain-containing protein n=1 Tax=Pseudohalioglobus sediminis TaxID=2606449 RepID=A0A5B0WQV1_9GAMM|nr:hypothetical protein [Pseudohalioglobus sediminis]KAA1188808.1 hypothetical protein F0M18_16505 [Pseudohalioglobus sediminis]